MVDQECTNRLCANFNVWFLLYPAIYTLQVIFSFFRNFLKTFKISLFTLQSFLVIGTVLEEFDCEVCVFLTYVQIFSILYDRCPTCTSKIFANASLMNPGGFIYYKKKNMPYANAIALFLSLRYKTQPP